MSSGPDPVPTPDGRPLADVLPFPSRGLRPAPDSAPDAPLLRHALGEVLREERLRQERTLRDVATEAAVSLPYLSEIERGRKEVSSEVLRSVCDALELPLTDLLDRSARRLRAGSQRHSGVQLRAA